MKPNFCNFQKNNKINKNLSISVAMCTYNGELFLQEQLESIALQTILPDELVVCDDGSTDNTLLIISNFKKEATFAVKVYRNVDKIPLGMTKNFEKAIFLCRSEIIVLSDFDDVWIPEKLEKLVQSFKENPSIGYVFSDALVVDERLFPLGYTMWEGILFTKYKRRLFKNGYQVEVLLKHNVVTGATMAFRAENRDWILPISNQWAHDEWIVLLLSAIGIKGNFIEGILIKYRQHHQQAIGGRKHNFWEQFQSARNTGSEYYNIRAHKFECIVKRLIFFDKLTKKNKKLFEAKIEHLKIRKKIHSHKKWKCYHLIFREFLNGHYHRFSNGWKSFIKDLCL